MDDLTRLLLRITDSEDFIDRAERFFAEKRNDWSSDLTTAFEKFLERKREQVATERDRAEKLGWNIALGTYPPRMDI